MVDLIGKKIIFFYPYGTTKHYGDAIRSELVRRGAVVKSYDERPSQGTFSKIVIRLLKKKVPQLFNRYIRKVIKESQSDSVDYILICRGEAFSPSTIRLLRDSFPSAKIILYLWDILDCADLRHVIPCVDKAFSFDPKDVSENKGLYFRPTFFVDQYTQVKDLHATDYDLVFIGTLHSKRHSIIKYLDAMFNKQGISFFAYLFVPSRIVYFKDLITKFPYISLSKVHFSPISVPETIKLLNNSKAIFDINYTTQTSLSTRAYEAMAARRKYVTTNPEVMNYNFYNPNNVLVLNLDSPEIPKDFFESPFTPIPEHVLYEYSVKGLVDDLFD